MRRNLIQKVALYNQVTCKNDNNLQKCLEKNTLIRPLEVAQFVTEIVLLLFLVLLILLRMSLFVLKFLREFSRSNGLALLHNACSLLLSSFSVV